MTSFDNDDRKRKQFKQTCLTNDDRTPRKGEKENTKQIEYPNFSS